MITLEDYNSLTIKLANSLVIKSLDVAFAINKSMLLSGYTITDDKTTWKYFLNLAGLKHPSNSDVQITVTELGEKRSLTKDLLNRYKYTKKELYNVSSMYNELLSQYPNDILYIHGCMYPVDLNTAINAKDGAILAYNTSFIEKQEYELIEQLEDYIVNYLKRWNVISYQLVDELFVPAMLAGLYASLPAKIMNLRLENAHTNQAHSFHLEHYFRSDMNIWDEISILKKETIYWLYHNLPLITKNIGKHETLNTIITKIFTPNFMGIGNYNLKIPNVSYNKDATTEESSFTRNKVVTNMVGLNSYCYADPNAVINPTEIILKEIELTKSNNNFINLDTNSELEKNESLINHTLKQINNSYTDNQKTKLLEITSYNLFKRNNIDLFKLAFDHFVYAYKHNNVSFLEEFVEPNSSRVYLCEPKTAILMFIKLIMKMTGSEDVKISRIYYDTVLNADSSCIDRAMGYLFPDGYTNKFVKDIKDNYPEIGMKLHSPLEIKDLVKTVDNFYSYLWLLDANSESGYVSMNLKSLYSLIMETGYLELTDKPGGDYIDNILADNNVEFYLGDNFNLIDTYEAMVLAFMGITINEYKELEIICNSFKSLLNKLVSYTLQVSGGDIGKDTIFVKYNNIGILRTARGIATILDGSFDPIEHNKSTLSVQSTNFKDIGLNIPMSNLVVKAAMQSPKKVTLKGTIDNGNRDSWWIAPKVYAEMTNGFIYNMNK